MSETMYITCHFCQKQIASRRVESDGLLPGWLAERWHLRMASHIRKEHMR